MIRGRMASLDILLSVKNQAERILELEMSDKD
jgi:hypothetical protein